MLPSLACGDSTVQPLNKDGHVIVIVQHLEFLCSKICFSVYAYRDTRYWVGLRGTKVMFLCPQSSLHVDLFRPIHMITPIRVSMLRVGGGGYSVCTGTLCVHTDSLSNF